MKILHYLNDIRFSQGGVVRCVLDLCAWLAAHGHDVTLATQIDQDVPEEWKRAKHGFPRVALLGPPTVGGLMTLADRTRVRELIAGADLVHLHGVWTPSNLPFASAARRRGIPYVYTVHGMLDDWSMSQRGLKKRVFLSVVGRRTLEKAACVHCTAKAELEQARRWFPMGNGIVIPYVMDLNEFRELPGPGPAKARFGALNQGRPNVLFLSRLHEKKGIELLLGAAGLLRKKGVDANYLLAGTGDPEYTAQLAAIVKRLELQDRVHMLGLVVGREKLSLYEAADLFVLPTYQENFGFVLTESLACRTPVVTTRGVDIWEELESSGAAKVIELAEKQATSESRLADAISAMLKDPAALSAMRDRGREWVFRTLDPATVTKQFEAVYLEAVQAAAAGR